MIPGSGRSPGEGKSYPFQYSGLENSMDCMVTWVHKEWDTTERLSRSRKDVVFALSIGEVISKPLEWHAWGSTLGFSGGAGGKEPTCQSRRHKRHGFDPWIGKIPLKEGMATHCITHAQRIPGTEEAGRI